MTHKAWGTGRVVKVSGSGEDQELDIAFEAKGVKRLLAAFAPITKKTTKEDRMEQPAVSSLTLTTARAEIGPLRQKLREWGQQYYEADQPTVPDDVYDQQYRRLVEIEERFPELVSPDSPTQQVGGAAASEFTKVQHRIPLLSLGDVFFQSMSFMDLLNGCNKHIQLIRNLIVN